MTKTFWERNPGADRYEYTFAEEVAARSNCARVWLQLREFEKAKPDAYLDQLIEVFKAGFLPEYAWTYFGNPGWAQPANLRLTEFDLWRRTNLRDHKPETKAVAEYEGKQNQPK